jgi:hypothetical protein
MFMRLKININIISQKKLYNLIRYNKLIVINRTKISQFNWNKV